MKNIKFFYYGGGGGKGDRIKKITVLSVIFCCMVQGVGGASRT